MLFTVLVAVSLFVYQLFFGDIEQSVYQIDDIYYQATSCWWVYEIYFFDNGEKKYYFVGMIFGEPIVSSSNFWREPLKSLKVVRDVAADGREWMKVSSRQSILKELRTHEFEVHLKNP